VTDVVFGIGPLINAAGRLGDARDAVRLLLAAERNSALEAAGNPGCAQPSNARKPTRAPPMPPANRVLDDPAATGRKSIVLFDPSWHKGIIGIAASRMVEQFHRPAVILTESRGKAVGSARSVPGFDLHAALSRCEHLFSSFGGHAHRRRCTNAGGKRAGFIQHYSKKLCP
jgi:single-stranded-DNA-specific exonuclease